MKGARFVYRLATNLPDPKEWTSLARFGNELRSDLNPLEFAERANELNPYEVTFYAAAELPSAESQFWSVAQPKVPKGRVQRDRFISKVLLFFRARGLTAPWDWKASRPKVESHLLRTMRPNMIPCHVAVAAGCVDFVLSPEYIAKELARIAQHPSVAGPPLDSNR